jgi:rhodanese-related sulfurtransferase
LDFFFENILLISIAFISGGLLVWPLLTKNIGLKKLGTVEATTMLNRQNGILVDLRENDDLSGGVIPQAERIPSSILLKKREGFDKHKKKFQDKKNQNKPIILMGNKISTVSVVGKLLKENGFEEVFCLDGGIESWIEAGLPVRSTEK